MEAPRLRRGAYALAAGAALVGVVLGARQLAARPRAQASALRAALLAGAPSTTLRVPHLPGSIVLDGDTDDPGWTSPPGPGRTGAFASNGVQARPYSDVRAVWGDGHLYLALYAADEDIRSLATEHDAPLWLEDSFRVVFSSGDAERAIEVSPRGVVTDAMRTSPVVPFDYSWESGVHVSPELDGTVNDPKDADEEWVIEMAIPFEALGMKGERGESVGFSVHRCDQPKGAPRVCAGWGEGQANGVLVLE